MGLEDQRRARGALGGDGELGRDVPVRQRRNELDVWLYFDLVVCLVIDDETLRHRLATQTTNEFGKHPGELEAALARNQDAETEYRKLGVTTVDATRPLHAVVRDVLAIAGLATGTDGPG